MKTAMIKPSYLKRIIFDMIPGSFQLWFCSLLQLFLITDNAQASKQASKPLLLLNNNKGSLHSGSGIFSPFIYLADRYSRPFFLCALNTCIFFPFLSHSAIIKGA